MAPPQQARVLRCCCCSLFQAHQVGPPLPRARGWRAGRGGALRGQSSSPRPARRRGLSLVRLRSVLRPGQVMVKKSLKWTCKACGKKQSFLQAYGEGSGADCRRHVQKLNLLQGQISEMSLRSLGESISANEEENVGPWQAASAGPQEKPQPSKNRWLKYLERDSEELGLKEGLCFNRQPSSEREKPDPPFSTGLPRKRKWNQSTVQPLCIPHVQDSRNCEVTLKSLKDRSLHSTWSARSSPDCSTWDLPWISEELSPSFTQAVTLIFQ